MKTKERILAKGGEILILKGYHHTGIQEILAAAEVPKGSFYHFFKNKEDFVFQVLDDYCRAVDEHLDRLFDDRAAPPLERMRNFFKTAADNAQSKAYKGGCLIGNLSQELGDLNPAFANHLEAKWLNMENRLAQCIQEAVDCGDTRFSGNPKCLAAFLINSWQGAMMRAKVSRCPAAMDHFVDQVFDNVLN